MNHWHEHSPLCRVNDPDWIGDCTCYAYRAEGSAQTLAGYRDEVSRVIVEAGRQGGWATQPEAIAAAVLTYLDSVIARSRPPCPWCPDEDAR